MRVAIAQVKDGAAQAVVSVGNTGTLIAISRYDLKTLEGIDRPAIRAKSLGWCIAQLPIPAIASQLMPVVLTRSRFQIPVV